MDMSKNNPETEITYRCVHCRVQIHPYHLDPITSLQYEGDNAAAGVVHTTERCREARSIMKEKHE
jgi:hypothetical protein